MRYVRSPASFFAESIWTPCFLPAVEMKPRTLCACESVAFMISASVSPLARAIISRIFAPLLSARGAAAFLAAVGLAALLLPFAAAVAVFLGAAALALATVAVFLAFGVPFLAGSLLGGGLLRRDVRALFRNGGGFVGSGGFCGRHVWVSFSALLRA
jgi:hypothetical protein